MLQDGDTAPPPARGYIHTLHIHTYTYICIYCVTIFISNKFIAETSGARVGRAVLQGEDGPIAQPLRTVDDAWAADLSAASFPAKILRGPRFRAVPLSKVGLPLQDEDLTRVRAKNIKLLVEKTGHRGPDWVSSLCVFYTSISHRKKLANPEADPGLS